MPLIQAAIRDVENGHFPKSCFLNIGIPASPSTNKVSASTLEIMITSLFFFSCTVCKFPLVVDRV
jgi:hypothetical protein